MDYSLTCYHSSKILPDNCVSLGAELENHQLLNPAHCPLFKKKISIIDRVKGLAFSSFLAFFTLGGACFNSSIRKSFCESLRVVSIKQNKFRTFLEKTTEEVWSNSSLELASIYLIGESHTDSNRKLQQTSIIDEFSREGDILLLEEYSKEDLESKRAKEFIQKKFFQSKKIHQLIIFSWDNDLLKNQQILLLYFLVSLLKKNIEIVPTLFSNDKTKKSGKFREKFYIHDLFKTIRKIKQEITNKRSEHLFKRVLFYRKKYPYKKIFVVAGIHHIGGSKNDISIVNFLLKCGDKQKKKISHRFVSFLFRENSTVSDDSSVEYTGQLLKKVMPYFKAPTVKGEYIQRFVKRAKENKVFFKLYIEPILDELIG